MRNSERLIRHCARSQSGWNNGDLDVAFQLFSCGMVWDGNLVSKSSRDHLVRAGYAVRADGYRSLTGKGVVAMLTSPPVSASAYRRWRMLKRNPLVASPEMIKRAID